MTNDNVLTKRFQRYSRLAGFFAILIGFFNLMGFDPTVAMKPNTAFCFVLSGISLLCFLSQKPTRLLRFCAKLLGLIVFGVGVLTLGEYAFNTSFFGLDHLLPPGGRMAPATALMLAINGFTYQFMDDKRNYRWSQYLSVLGLFIALIPCLGFALGAHSLLNTGPFKVLAIQTAWTLLALSLATLFARPSRGFVAIMVSHTSGGMLVRRFLPLFFILLVAIDFLILKGRERGLYDVHLGHVALLVLSMAFISGLIFRIAYLLHAQDLEKKHVDEKIQANQKQLIDHARRQQVIADLGKKALTGEELELLLHEVTAKTANVLRVEYCMVLELLPDGSKLLLKEGIGWKEGVVGQVVGDVEILKREHEVKNGISAVIHGQQQLYGLLEVYTTEARHFTTDDIHFLQSTANLLSYAIQRKKTEEELQQKTEALTRSNKELEQFTYVASHDLQEPLRKMITFSNRLKSHLTDIGEVDRQYIDRMQDTGSRMKKMIEDLLAFSRVGTISMPLEQIDFKKVVEEAMNDLEARIEETHAQIDIGPLPQLPGNASQMHQLFLNLLSNALKYCCKKDEPPRIQISSQDISDEMVRIIVKDNGIGFNEKFANEIFKPFKRLHARSEFEGSGIGLAICQKIVHRHGGRIFATSKLDEGTSIYIELPRRVAAPVNR